MESKKGPLYKRVNEIDELYSSPKIRQYYRESARETHEHTANFIQKVVKLVGDLKSKPSKDLSKYLNEYLSNCPWPFGLIILEERKGKRPGEIECTQLYGSERTTRRLSIPDDIAAVHTFLALFRDEYLEYVDRIVTYEIRDICSYIGVSPLIMSNTTEMLEKEIPALIRCAREDLEAKGLHTSKSETNAQNKKSRKHENQIEEEWSNPMTKTKMMRALHIEGSKKFTTFAEDHGLKQVGKNRQLWQIRLDKMDLNTRRKLEKA